MRSNFIVILLMIVAYTNFGCQKRISFRKNELQLVISNVTQCSSHENLPIYVKPMKIIQRGRNDYFIDGEVVYKENFTHGYKVNSDLYECETPDEDSCSQVFANIRTGELCAVLGIETAPYASILRTIKPPYLCPLHEGIYKFDNIIIDNTLIKYLPDKPCNFKIKVYGHLKERLVSCVYIRFYTRVRRTRK